ncbi:MAG TPA: hypothetical protein VJ183_13410 [Chloroflexia bacterium]|nr:hypothetical protein [Chloroflexia bacterium]
MKRKLFLVAPTTLLFMLIVMMGVEPQNSNATKITNSTQVVSAEPNSPLVPVGSGFTYQGHLLDNGNPANGQYDFVFTLFDALSGGNQVGTVTLTSQTVSDGLYTATLDFGAGTFQGEARWLQISVRRVGAPSYTTLSPRVALTATPYALSLQPGAVISGTTPYITLNVFNNTASDVPTIYASAIGGTAVYAFSSNRIGVYAISPNSVGVYANGGYAAVQAISGGGYGVSANSNSSVGVYSESQGSNGVFGVSRCGDDANRCIGVHGTDATGGGSHGVFGSALAFGIGVGGGNLDTTNGWAGFFTGRVRITGGCCNGPQLTTQVDHPQDPANKYLNHYSVQSSESLDFYRGHAILDAQGEAWVNLPDWFESLNEDFEYQLTAIGGPGRDLYIAQEIKDSRFQIAGGKAGMKVSWQITATRKNSDTSRSHLPVEQDKPERERGYYLQPELYGQPDSKLLISGPVDPTLNFPATPEVGK